MTVIIFIDCERTFVKVDMYSWNFSIERLNCWSCNSIFFSISHLISNSSLLWTRTCWSIGIFFHGFLFLRLKSISFIFSRDYFFSLPWKSLVFSHSKLLSISSSWLDSPDLSLLQIDCGVDDQDWNVVFSILDQSYETKHQLNQQHHLNHCSCFQWLVIQTISGCTSRKTLLQLDHSHFVCQNQHCSIAYTHLLYCYCNLLLRKKRLSKKSWLIFW